MRERTAGAAREGKKQDPAFTGRQAGKDGVLTVWCTPRDSNPEPID